ncbi:MAG: CarD family transcriptional regulator [Anaerolineales bacterium]
MEFKIGDLIVHPAHGVGHIVRLEQKQFFGDEERLYYEVATQKSTVWVPVEASEASGIRQLTPKPDLARYRRLLKSRPDPLNQDNRQRQLEISSRLKQGSFQILCEVVRDLTAHGWRKPLSESNAASLRRARESLYEEWAAAEGVSIAEATQEVEALLNEAKQAFRV